MKNRMVSSDFRQSTLRSGSFLVVVARDQPWLFKRYLDVDKWRLFISCLYRSVEDLQVEDLLSVSWSKPWVTCHHLPSFGGMFIHCKNSHHGMDDHIPLNPCNLTMAHMIFTDHVIVWLKDCASQVCLQQFLCHPHNAILAGCLRAGFPMACPFAYWIRS